LREVDQVSLEKEQGPAQPEIDKRYNGYKRDHDSGHGLITFVSSRRTAFGASALERVVTHHRSPCPANTPAPEWNAHAKRDHRAQNNCIDKNERVGCDASV
jgi:hypothetical protein